MDNHVILVDNLEKNFKLPHQKAQSDKNIFTGIFSFGNRTIEIQHALKDISFKVKEGEFFGIVGRNGSGKSTLLKILAGIYQPSSGSVRVNGRVVPFIELGVGFNGELTGRENVYLNGALLGFSEKEISAKYDSIVDFAELERFMDQKLKNYSSGMQVRVAFSVATKLAESDILLIDEVLAVGDASFQRKCLDYFRVLKKNKKTVVFVSHDMNAIREYCDKAILIEKNEIVAAGSPDKIASKYARMFIDESNQVSEKSKKNDKRWGDKVIKYELVTVTQHESDEKIVIKTRAKATEYVNSPIFGFAVRSSTGQTILGTNNQICQQRISSLKPGQVIELSWEMPNVLNDGTYFIDPAILYDNGASTADWWEEAAEIEVRKEYRTPYMVNPQIKLIVSR